MATPVDRRLTDRPVAELDAREAQLARHLAKLPPAETLSGAALARIERQLGERRRPALASRTLAALVVACVVLAVGVRYRARHVAAGDGDGEVHVAARASRRLVEAGGRRLALVGPAAARWQRTGLQLRDGRLAVSNGAVALVVEGPDARVTLPPGFVGEVQVVAGRTRVAAYVGRARVEYAGHVAELSAPVADDGTPDAATATALRRRLSDALGADAIAPTAPAPIAAAIAAPAIAAPAIAAPAAATGALGAEAHLLAAALRALGEHDPRRALAALDRHDAEFAQGALAPEATHMRVEALLTLGRRAAALTLLDGRTLDPALLVTRGELRAGAGRLAAARADFDAALTDIGAPGAVHERALFGRAACFASMGDDARARADLTRYLREFPAAASATEARRLLAQ